jgi:hypothetical protein
MADFNFIHCEPGEELAQLHYFSIKKCQPGGDVEFIITVYEYAERNKQFMKFYARADKAINQKSAAFTPFGWGETLTSALSECVKEIRRYPYEADK